jgi:hypothetical protein
MTTVLDSTISARPPIDIRFHQRRGVRPVRVAHHIYQPTRCELAMAALQPLVDDWDLDAWAEVSRLERCRCTSPHSTNCFADYGLAARVLAGEFAPEAA